MAYRIAIIYGDGIGPEVMGAAKRVVDATNIGVEWVEVAAGQSALVESGSMLPASTIEAIRSCGVALKAPLITPHDPSAIKPNLALKQALGLQMTVRPARTWEGAPSRYQGVDLVVVRESSEGPYMGSEMPVGDNAAVAISSTTRAASERAARFAFEYAVRHGRRKVSVIHKTAVFRLTDGMFQRAALEVARDYPQIAVESIPVDTVCLQLVRNPEQLDVLLTSFLYGDILNDLCAGLVGGLGLAPGASFGNECAVFEAVHGAAPKYAGQNKTNPCASILSASLMLAHLDEPEASNRIVRAVESVIRQRDHVTYDLGGSAGTREMTDAIIRQLVTA